MIFLAVDDWAKFARACPVRTQVRYNIDDYRVEGELIATSPIDDEYESDSLPMLPIRITFQSPELLATDLDVWFARHMSFFVWGGWYTLDDILMADENEDQS